MHGCIKHFIRVEEEEEKAFCLIKPMHKTHTHHVSLAIDGGACLIDREQRKEKDKYSA